MADSSAQTVVAINRVRRCYLEVAPELRPHFPLTDYDDPQGALSSSARSAAASVPETAGAAGSGGPPGSPVRAASPPQRPGRSRQQRSARCGAGGRGRWGVELCAVALLR